MAQLERVVGPSQLFVLAFGCVVGSGWIVVLGEWLAAAAPGGAIVGFIAGAVGMLAVCAAYAELVARIPVAGGEFEFSRQIFGPKVAFPVGWFSTLFLISVASFEGIALSWIIGAMLPDLHMKPLYRSFDADVSAFGLIIGVGVALALGALHYRGIAGAARLQKIVTMAFGCLAAVVIAAGIAFGSVANLNPFFTPLKPQPWWQGALWVFASAPFFLSGFQSVPQVIEERSPGVSYRTVARAMYGAVVLGCVFYCGIVFASAMAAQWTSLPGRPLPAVAAVEALLPNGILSRLLLLAAALSVVKLWNGILLWAARLVMAQARAGLLPVALSRVHPRFGSPHIAVLAVCALNICGVLLGRGVLVPLLNMTSICGAFTMALAGMAALRLRMRPGWTEAPYAAPGGKLTLMVGLLCASAMALYAGVEPFLQPHRGIPLEWQLMGGWAVVGGIVWCFKVRGRASSHA